MVDDDLRLVQACLQGDQRAITSLVEKFQADVYRLCQRILHHHQDAEDVTQEVFVRVFRSLRRWDGKRPLRPWIFGIAVNRCRTWLAKRAKRPESVSYLHDVVADKPTDDVDELAAEIQKAVSRMREEYRTVFALFHDQGLAYEDIAAAIDRPIGTVKTWLRRARLEVLDQLKQRGMISEVEHELQ